MGQYRLWLQHRTIDQELRTQQLMQQKELSEIDEHIARLEETGIDTSNPLLTMLMQQLKPQEHTTSTIIATTATQLEHNGALPAIANGQIYQAPPPSNYGLQGNDPQIAETALTAPSPQASPGLLAWGHLPNFSTQDIHVPAEQPADRTGASPVPTILPAATDHLLPSNLDSILQPQPQVNAQLPWWLRNLMQSSHAEQEPPQETPINPQSEEASHRVGLWFARRTRLVHYDQ